MADEDPLVEPAANLREIIRLVDVVELEAGEHGDDREMPGGEPLAAVAPVAPAHARMVIVAGDYVSPLQTLLFWTEDYRRRRDDESTNPTLATEAEWLRSNLAWIRMAESHWRDFTEDVWRVRRYLEAITREGERSTPGIQCPRCKRAAMIRTEHDRSRPRGCNGHGPLGICRVTFAIEHRRLVVRACNCADRGGLIDAWKCPECGHQLTNTPSHAEYDEAVLKAYVGSAPYLPGQFVERRTNVTHATVRVWAHRGHVATMKDERDQVVYCIADIERRLAHDASAHSVDSGRQSV